MKNRGPRVLCKKTIWTVLQGRWPPRRARTNSLLVIFLSPPRLHPPHALRLGHCLAWRGNSERDGGNGDGNNVEDYVHTVYSVYIKNPEFFGPRVETGRKKYVFQSLCSLASSSALFLYLLLHYSSGLLFHFLFWSHSFGFALILPDCIVWVLQSEV